MRSWHCFNPAPAGVAAAAILTLHRMMSTIVAAVLAGSPSHGPCPVGSTIRRADGIRSVIAWATETPPSGWQEKPRRVAGAVEQHDRWPGALLQQMDPTTGANLDTGRATSGERPIRGEEHMGSSPQPRRLDALEAHSA